MTPNYLTATVISNQKLSSNFHQIVCQTTQILNYTPGQYIIVKIHDSRVSQYSLVSSSPDSFTLLIDTTPDGESSKYFKNLKEGDQLQYLPPMGLFTLQPDVTSHVLFMATGSGIAPFISMLDQLISQSDSRPVKLLFGLRKEQDIFYTDLLNQIKDSHPQFDYLISLSDDSTHYATGYVQTHLESLSMPWDKTAVYLCGSPSMIHDSFPKLLSLGVNQSHIYYEKFY
jgi:benzoate/toluate 1,2-dioxygenase reductase component